MPTPHAHESSHDNIVPVQALLLVDLQEDFFSDPELQRCRADVVDACNALVERARAAGALVVVVRTVHAKDRSTWTLSMLEDDQGMTLEGEPGTEVIAELATDDAVEIVKSRDSAFFDTELDSVLRSHGVTAFALAGVSTESCIAATATDAYAHDYRVVLADRATASVDADMHEHLLRLLSWQYRQPVLEPAEITFEEAAAAR